MNNIVLEDWAAAVTQTTGAALKARGCSVSRDGGNVFTYTLDKELDESECVADVTVIGGDGLGAVFHMVNHVSDSVKEVRFFYTSGGAAQAIAHMVAFRKLT